MGTTARTATLAAACVLALAAFVTTTSEGALWSWGGGERSTTESSDRDTCRGEDCEEVINREIDEPPDLQPPVWLDTLGNVLLVVLSAFLIALIIRRLRFVRRAKLLQARRQANDPMGAFEEPAPADPEVLADELAERLAALAGGSPRNAIVAAWIALEATAQRAGIEPLETETPAEFTSRALARYHLDQDALQRLADLYREARFSRHRLTEHHLTQARDCLTVLSDDLRRAVPRTSGSSP
jgi:hypothetical protein